MSHSPSLSVACGAVRALTPERGALLPSLPVRRRDTTHLSRQGGGHPEAHFRNPSSGSGPWEQRLEEGSVDQHCRSNPPWRRARDPRVRGLVRWGKNGRCRPSRRLETHGRRPWPRRPLLGVLQAVRVRRIAAGRPERDAAATAGGTQSDGHGRHVRHRPQPVRRDELGDHSRHRPPHRVRGGGQRPHDLRCRPDRVARCRTPGRDVAGRGHRTARRIPPRWRSGAARNGSRTPWAPGAG